MASIFNDELIIEFIKHGFIWLVIRYVVIGVVGIGVPLPSPFQWNGRNSHHRGRIIYIFFYYLFIYLCMYSFIYLLIYALIYFLFIYWIYSSTSWLYDFNWCSSILAFYQFTSTIPRRLYYVWELCVYTKAMCFHNFEFSTKKIRVYCGKPLLPISLVFLPV